MRFCCDDRAKNLLGASISMGLVVMAAAPATVVQNIALAESTDIDLMAGYYSEVARLSMSIIAAVLFHPVYQVIGIKFTALISTFLVTGSYWPMIWIVNKYVVYLGAAISGVGTGIMWVLWPKVVIDNSDEGKAQKNMTYWWVALSMGYMIGGLCNYFYFHGVTKISAANRVMVYAICVGITTLASLIAAFGVTDIKEDQTRHRPLKEKDTLTYTTVCQGEDTTKVEEVDVKVLMATKAEEDTNTKGFREALEWFNVMKRRPEFWLLFVPLVYWGFIWGYFIKIVPTAVASISDKRNLIPLMAVINGASFLVGSSTWTFITKMTNNTFCILLASTMHLGALTLSILTFPKGAASEIMELGLTETYIKPDSIYIVVIAGLIGLADSGISIIFYTAAGRVYGEGTSFGFSLNCIGFCIFYICAMFAPSLFDLHSYCYSMGALVCVMCGALTIGLRKFI